MCVRDEEIEELVFGVVRESIEEVGALVEDGGGVRVRYSHLIQFEVFI